MKRTKKLTLAALFLALGLVMPFLTMQIPEIGSMLLPMHIPVLICGFVCGWKYGLAVGFIVPLLRSMIWVMPYMVPTAVCMAFELAAYGAVTGFLYRMVKGKKLAIYMTLLCAMVLGRAVWGLAAMVVYSLIGTPFTWEVFVGGALLQAIPGIILQIVIIPPIVATLQRSGFLEK